MKIKSTSLGMLLCISALSALSQPRITQQRSIGTISECTFADAKLTPDSGLLIGNTSSALRGADKSADNYGTPGASTDYWLIKLRTNGSKQWDKTLGGTAGETLSSVINTPDGGYLVAGSSYSAPSADKTEPNRDGTGATSDYWVVKLDSRGNKQWDKTLGGSDQDVLRAVATTPDGGYILAGVSYSTQSGDKLEFARGGGDIWVIKLRPDGSKQWDKTLGGTAHEEAGAILSTADGYLVGGSSASNASGDKSSDSKGGSDYWIVRLDRDGNVRWDRTFGTSDAGESLSTLVPAGGGYLAGGISAGGSGGDKTAPSRGSADYWLVKIDGGGNKLWDKTVGGTAFDRLSSVQPTADGGFVLAGYTSSGIGADKTEPSIAGNGRTDFWDVKLDSRGNIQWDKTLGGSGDEFASAALEYGRNVYVTGGGSASAPSGNRTVALKGTFDDWFTVLSYRPPAAASTALGE